MASTSTRTRPAARDTASCHLQLRRSPPRGATRSHHPAPRAPARGSARADPARAPSPPPAARPPRARPPAARRIELDQRPVLQLDGPQQLSHIQRIAAACLPHRRAQLVARPPPRAARTTAPTASSLNSPGRTTPAASARNAASDAPSDAGSLGRSATSTHRQPLKPRSQVSQPAQRGLVSPMRVIDRDQQRSTVREIDRQPVQPVQDRKRRINGDRPARSPNSSDRTAPAGPANNPSACSPRRPTNAARRAGAPPRTRSPPQAPIHAPGGPRDEITARRHAASTSTSCRDLPHPPPPRPHRHPSSSPSTAASSRSRSSRLCHELNVMPGRRRPVEFPSPG